MLAGILTSLISGLVAPMLLQLWKEWREKKAVAAQHVFTASAAPAPAIDAPFSDTRQASSGRGKRTGRAVVRLLLSPMIGFFSAAFIAAFLESRGHPVIEFGSDLSLVLIAFCSFAAWSILSIRSRS